MIDPENPQEVGVAPEAPPAPVIPTLTPEEARVFGCLLEKQATTPDNYPLSLNSLTNACNQKSSRDPVVNYSEQEVLTAMEGLREKKFACLVSTADGRVPKYRHLLEDRLSLLAGERAALCLLLLRGPQTPGEIRGRADRLHTYPTIPDAQEALSGLMRYPKGALAAMLPREPGRKEHRYAHCLCGPPANAVAQERGTSRGQECPRHAEADPVAESKLQELKETVASLQDRLARLEQEFASFRDSFH